MARSMGPSSGKQVGQAFVQRLLEKGDIHPAVAVLLGFGEHDDAIEVYVSRGFYMEAVLLTCLTMPSDWQRQSYLVRKWGEASVMQGQPELAPKRNRHRPLSSEPSTFSAICCQITPMAGMLGVGVTPIAESAISPGGAAPWLRSGSRFDRDPSSARTATPGGYMRRQIPPRSGTSRTRDTSQTPLTARREMSGPAHVTESLEMKNHGHSRSSSSIVSSGKVQSLEQASKQPSQPDRLPSPSSDVFALISMCKSSIRPICQHNHLKSLLLGLNIWIPLRTLARGETKIQITRQAIADGQSSDILVHQECHLHRQFPCHPMKSTPVEQWPQPLPLVQTSRRTSRADNQAPNRQRNPSQVDQRLAVRNRDRSESRPNVQSSRSRAASVQGNIEPRTQADPVSEHHRKSLGEDSSASENLNEDSVRRRDIQTLTKKQLAARELEERRASLARRPSAPAIPLPSDVKTPPKRPFMAPRHHTELGDTPSSFMPPYSGGQITRSHTADSESKGRFPNTKNTGVSIPTVPIGLPATPRAMRHPRYMSADPNEHEEVPAVPQISETPPQLTSATFQQESPSSKAAEDDQIAPLLPSTVFGQPAALSPPRSSSAPPETNTDGTPWHYKTVLPHSSRRGSVTKGGHNRKVTPTDNSFQPQNSPLSNRPSIDQTLHDTQIVIVEDSELMLPELQHLAGPPPPPPPPLMTNNRVSGLGVIDIAIGEEEPIIIDVLPTIDRVGALTAPPLNSFAQAQAQAQAHMQSQAQRRGRGSISEGINSRLRSVTERIRNNSKSRTKSPPIEAYAPSPYETVIPSMFARQLPDNSLARATSPYEASPIITSAAASEASLSLQNAIPPPPPPPPPPAPSAFVEQSEISAKASQGYPHPREVRANMPSETLLSPGVYQPDNMF
ncbi:hypothetical protein KCU99_g129, partial [Aureobasidium melanogenum]